MSAREVDWVVQPESWRHRLQPAYPLETNTFIDLPLTVPENWSMDPGDIDQQRYREVQSSTTHLMTRGVVHWWLNPTGTWSALWQIPWYHQITMRIRRILGDPQRQENTPLSLTYDLSDAPSANEEFLWHREITVANIPLDEWSQSPASRGRWNGSVQVFTKGRRRLTGLDQMVLTIQFSRVAIPSGDGWPFAEFPPMQLRVMPKLRSLLSV